MVNDGWRGQGGVPDGHARARDGGQLDGARETLVTLRIIVLQADLEFDGLEEVSLLLVQGVFEKLLHVLAHSGCGILLAGRIESRRVMSNLTD